MSGAGRGTRRASPNQGTAPSEPLFLAPGPANGTWSFYVPPASKWQRRLEIASPLSQVLTPSYVEYNYVGGQSEFSIPYGGVRMAVICTYTPGEIGGQLGLSVRWLDGPGSRIPTLVMSDDSSTSFGVTGDVTSAEVETFEYDAVTPAAPSTDPITFRIPFWIPPVEFTVNAVREANSLMEIFIREASGLPTPGDVTIDRLLIESFGEARPVASLP